MTGYTIVNLKEVEDQAPKFGHSPELEARFARVPFGHKHLQQEEVYVLAVAAQRSSPTMR